MNNDFLIASQKAETSVDIIECEKSDCILSLRVSVEDKTIISSDHEMTFDEAEDFVLSLKKQIKEIRDSSH